MAKELGLGITPWSPLRGGVLTGKYTRENAATAEPGRGARVTAYLNEHTFAILDELQRVGEQVGAPPSAIALAWVQSKPGVTSTIIGARTMEQLDQNLTGLDVPLSADQIAGLDKVSEPTLSFPSPFLEMANTIMHSGATVNGEPSESWPMAPGSEEDRH
jgi:aryl-alcohol dehydrogenase-like predicted oxidoreductase